MNRTRFSKFILCSLAALALAVGCDQPVTRIAEPFDNAPPDVKAAWQRALAADNTNDYATAIATLDWLNKRKLTDPQMNALSAERAKFSERLLKAVMRNDPAAIRAYRNSPEGRKALNQSNRCGVCLEIEHAIAGQVTVALKGEGELLLLHERS